MSKQEYLFLKEISRLFSNNHSAFSLSKELIKDRLNLSNREFIELYYRLKQKEFISSTYSGKLYITEKGINGINNYLNINTL